MEVTSTRLLVVFVALASCSTESASIKDTEVTPAPLGDGVRSMDQTIGVTMENPYKPEESLVELSDVVVLGRVREPSCVDACTGGSRQVEIAVEDLLKGDAVFEGDNPLQLVIRLDDPSRALIEDRSGIIYLSMDPDGFAFVPDAGEIPADSVRTVRRILAGLPGVDPRYATDELTSLFNRADLVVEVFLTPSEDRLTAKVTKVTKVYKGDAEVGPYTSVVVSSPRTEIPGGPWLFTSPYGHLFIKGSLDDPTVLNDRPYSLSMFGRDELKLLETLSEGG